MKNILITGPAGAGKTTLIKRLCVIFKEFNPAGFITSEIMEEGALAGFEVSNLLGDSKVFAHTKFKSKVVSGRFKIDLKAFDTFIENTFAKEKKTGLYVIDEICKVECSSKKFIKQLTEMLNSKKPLIATISDKGTGIITDIKKRDDVRIFELTEQNRELKLKELTMIIRDLLLE